VHAAGNGNGNEHLYNSYLLRHSADNLVIGRMSLCCIFQGIIGNNFT
jgi:hypothetical protein